MENISLDHIYLPSDKVISRCIEDDLIIVPIESNTIDFDHSLYSLTSTGIDIWERLNQNTTVKKLCLDLSEKYDASFEVIVQDVTELLGDLLEKGIIVQSDHE